MALPEYASLIEELTRRKNQDKAQADAAAQGEAQRRGLVNQTGTSDIEASLRGARTAPIEQAYTGQISQLLGDQAAKEASQKYQTSERLGGQEFAAGQSEAARKFQTGERLGTEAYNTSERTGTQNYNTGENAAERNFRTNERLGTQNFNTGERVASQNYNTGENTAGRDWQANQAETERQFQDYLDLRNKGWTDAQIQAANRGWWKAPVGAAGAVVGGTILTDALKKLLGL